MAAVQANNTIKLGLSRMLKLFPPRDIKFDALHVAGTNGKGTVCFYASHMLRSHGLRVGRFTSPHLVDRWDCININGRPVDEGSFRSVEAHYLKKNSRDGIGASQFEILTATAFDLFNMHDVDVGVIEVGVGGREDATNILPQERVLCSVITSISLDHQGLLGDTILEIANHKAGIIRRGVPVVYDGASGNDVTALIEETSRTVTETPREWVPESLARRSAQKPPILHDRSKEALFPIISERRWRKRLLSDVGLTGPFGDFFVPQNAVKPVALAARAAQVSILRLGKVPERLQDYASTINGHQWPGRMQSISLQPLADRVNPALLDGAHNTDSAWRLATFVTHRFRKTWTAGRKPASVTWLLAASAGKDLSGMLKRFLYAPGDTVIATSFGPVDGMPWVKPTPPEELLRLAHEVQELSADSAVVGTVEDAVKLAVASAKEGPLVIAGSLYLVSDVLRLLRGTGGSNEEWWDEWEKPVPWNQDLESGSSQTSSAEACL